MRLRFGICGNSCLAQMYPPTQTPEIECAITLRSIVGNLHMTSFRDYIFCAQKKSAAIPSGAHFWGNYNERTLFRREKV